MFRCVKNITTLYIQPGNKQARSDGSQRQKALALVVCHIRLIISQDIVSRNCFFAASANENSTKVTMDKQYLNYTPHWNLFRKRKQFIVMRSDNEMILSRSLHTSGSLRHNPAKCVAHWLPNGIMGHNAITLRRVLRTGFPMASWAIISLMANAARINQAVTLDVETHVQSGITVFPERH